MDACADVDIYAAFADVDADRDHRDADRAANRDADCAAHRNADCAADGDARRVTHTHLDADPDRATYSATAYGHARTTRYPDRGSADRSPANSRAIYGGTTYDDARASDAVAAGYAGFVVI
jgi:hypothetical protein